MELKTKMKTKTVVRIGGREYTMVGVNTEEHMKRLAVYVDRKMNELTLSTRLPPQMVAVLTAMNIADDLIRAQDENTRLHREILEVRLAAEGQREG